MDLRHGRLVTLHLHLHRGPYLTDPGMVTRCDMIKLLGCGECDPRHPVNRVIPLRGLSGDTAAGILEQFDNFAEETATGRKNMS
ncbi:hypothetical protein KCV05_g48, partial [Aureobasidium melanogenum]